MQVESQLQKTMMGLEEYGTRSVSSNSEGSTITEAGDTKIFEAEDSMGKEAFLNLLVTQLQNQDPLSPTSDQEFVAQLAQFSSLESSQNVEKNIGDLANSMKTFSESQTMISSSMNNSSATSLLGKVARVAQPIQNFDGVQNVKMDAHVDAGGSAYLQVIDESGEQVYIKALGNNGTGDYEVTWNGDTMNEGTKATSGQYGFRIVDSTGKNSKGFLYQEAPVNGVTYGANGAEIEVNGTAYSLGAIKQVIEKN
tara:strand:- start:495 stop:1253 length:759 start_codon:yes stop_codon:yes gene_type:complete